MKRIEGLIDPFVPFNEIETPPTAIAEISSIASQNRTGLR
jgi:hypothetical protein